MTQGLALRKTKDAIVFLFFRRCLEHRLRGFWGIKEIMTQGLALRKPQIFKKKYMIAKYLTPATSYQNAKLQLHLQLDGGQKSVV
jgi:hypothetical protein